MARQNASASGVDFHLPDEILAVIPNDPYEQLDVARKITSMAIASRVSRLEADVARLRHDLSDRDRAEADLRARLTETDARLLAALEENAKLVKEKESLAATTKKMARNLAKLEAFKKQLMKSLSEDNLLQLSETGQDHDTEDNLNAQVPSWKGAAARTGVGRGAGLPAAHGACAAAARAAFEHVFRYKLLQEKQSMRVEWTAKDNEIFRDICTNKIKGMKIVPGRKLTECVVNDIRLELLCRSGRAFDNEQIQNKWKNSTKYFKTQADGAIGPSLGMPPPTQPQMDGGNSVEAVEEVSEALRKLMEDHEALQKKYTDLTKKYMDECTERRRLSNEVIEKLKEAVDKWA